MEGANLSVSPMIEEQLTENDNYLYYFKKSEFSLSMPFIGSVQKDFWLSMFWTNSTHLKKAVAEIFAQ